MKKLLSIVALFVLLLVGVGAAYVINDPASVRSAVGVKDEPEPGKPETAKPAANKTGKVVAQAADEKSKAPAESFDRKAASEGNRKPAEGRRPPTREEFEKKLSQDLPTVESTRSARYVSIVDQGAVGEPPPPELYPIEVIRRTYPDANSMTVEIAIKNASGVHWKTAYVTIRSPRVKEGQLFEIEDWKIDEIVSLNYTFPRTEVDARVRDLRVVNVSGEERRSALADLLASNRRKLIGKTGDDDPSQRSGDVLTAPGLLGLFGQFQTPFTGIQIVSSSMQAAPKKHLAIEIPQDQLLPDAFQNPIRETSEERREIASLAEQFHASGVGVQNAVKDFVAAVESESYEDALKGEGKNALERLRTSLDEFNRLGVELATKAQRSNDAEVRQIRSLVDEHSRKIGAQLNALEITVQRVDERFKVTS